uniref:Latent transforming growth factor beta binding protein 1 n=1 Tax=Sander lucioperca TaxID=283035 RepID=A0A8D0CVT7_SANLU
GSYECYCKTGQDYDAANLQCTGCVCVYMDECVDESLCAGGQCLNTDGSYMCFCTHPMVLEPSSNRCVFIPEAVEQTDYQGICWQTVTQSMTCTRPLGPDRKTTYTECCCLYGEAWGMDCALCPFRNTGTHCTQQHTHFLSFCTTAPFKAFEGLQAEECGILNGCENGRCVRVQEGYTCDCFDGYTLDLSRMACIDVNECSELNNRMSLCKNAKCINTVGSYQCVCLPGFAASDKPNYCVVPVTHQTATHTGSMDGH